MGDDFYNNFYSQKMLQRLSTALITFLNRFNLLRETDEPTQDTTAVEIKSFSDWMEEE